MSSSASEPTLHLAPSPSRRLAALLIATHLGAVALLPWLPVSAWLAWPLGALTAVSLSRSLRHHVSRSAPAAVRALTWAPDGSWWLRDGVGVTHAATLQPAFVAHPWLVVLSLRVGPGRPRFVVLLPDSLERETSRRLRARLRLQAGHTAS